MFLKKWLKLLTLCALLFRVNEMKLKERSRAGWVATILSTLLWVLSLVLAFQIPGGSKDIWLPDTLLLLGFFPLLMLWRLSWLTLLFGIFNGLIGFFLLILINLESDKFVGQVLAMKDHLVSMHSPWAWLSISLIAVIWGAVACLIDLIKLGQSSIKSQKQTKEL